MGIAANIKRYRENHYISQEYVAEQLHMCQPNYSRIEKSDIACTKRLARIANVLSTTPETLQNYHLSPTSTGSLEAADWVKALLEEREETIQQQQETIKFQNRYVAYIYTVWKEAGINFGKPLDEPPTLIGNW